MSVIPDWRIVLVQAAGFILVLAVFKLFLFGPIMGILQARRQEIDSEYADSESHLKAAEELKAQYEQHLAKVGEEMRAKVAEAVKEGQTMREQILADSREQAEKILSRAQEELIREKEKAVVELKTAVAELTVKAAGKLIGAELDTTKHHELIGKVINDLDGVAG